MKSLLVSILFITAYLLTPEVTSAQLKLHHDKDTGTITVNKTEDALPILTQNAYSNFRPYIHPIVAPDGKGTITE